MGNKILIFLILNVILLQGKERNIHFGIASVLSPEESIIYYNELLKYASQKTNLPIKIKFGDYNEINNLLKLNKIECGFVCSGAYIKIKDYVEILAVPVINGKTTYKSYIIVGKNLNIEDFKELKNKSFAFVNEISLTGYIYPIYLLSKIGEKPDKFFSKILFTQSHTNSIIGVGKNLIDGAGVDSIIFEYYRKRYPEIASNIKIIDSSPEFGIPPIVVLKNLDKDIKIKLKNFFLNLHKDRNGMEILNKIYIDKFVEGDNNKYKEIQIVGEKVEEFLKR